MKLTPKERRQCRILAFADNPPAYDIDLIPGDVPPEWEVVGAFARPCTGDPRIATRIRITVGVTFLQRLRTNNTQSTKEKIQ